MSELAPFESIDLDAPIGQIDSELYQADVGGSDRWACEVRPRNGHTQEEAEAIATLFAASIQLYKLAKRYASECSNCNDGKHQVTGEPCDECHDIRAVIASAEGRQIEVRPLPEPEACPPGCRKACCVRWNDLTDQERGALMGSQADAS